MRNNAIHSETRMQLKYYTTKTGHKLGNNYFTNSLITKERVEQKTMADVNLVQIASFHPPSPSYLNYLITQRREGEFCVVVFPTFFERLSTNWIKCSFFYRSKHFTIAEEPDPFIAQRMPLFVKIISQISGEKDGGNGTNYLATSSSNIFQENKKEILDIGETKFKGKKSKRIALAEYFPSFMKTIENFINCFKIFSMMNEKKRRNIYFIYIYIYRNNNWPTWIRWFLFCRLFVIQCIE